jgi:hypothetical protein
MQATKEPLQKPKKRLKQSFAEVTNYRPSILAAMSNSSGAVAVKIARLKKRVSNNLFFARCLERGLKAKKRDTSDYIYDVFQICVSMSHAKRHKINIVKTQKAAKKSNPWETN